MSKKQTVSVVIPSWNSESQMVKNLPYVFAAAKAVNAEILVVDDHSEIDGSVSYLKSLGSKVKFYENDRNQGFALTVNRGVELSSGEVVILLNTDVRPKTDCFVKALKYFTNDKVFALNFNSQEDWMGGEWRRGLFHHFRVKPIAQNKNQLNPSLWASGGQGAFSRAKWLALGGMDSLFKPFYWEDVDLGFRAWKSNWEVLWAPECQVVHDHQKSVITNNFMEEFVMGVAQRNQFLFVWKNINDPRFIFDHLINLPYYLAKYPGPVLKALFLLPRALVSRAKAKHFWKRQDRDILKRWAR